MTPRCKRRFLSQNRFLRNKAAFFLDFWRIPVVKKETGSTLTEYVNRKRVEHAIFLLNSTNLQIQEIAAACGIPDVNYFTKIFKKQVGNTPKEYREKIF